MYPPAYAQRVALLHCRLTIKSASWRISSKGLGSGWLGMSRARRSWRRRSAPSTRTSTPPKRTWQRFRVLSFASVSVVFLFVSVCRLLVCVAEAVDSGSVESGGKGRGKFRQDARRCSREKRGETGQTEKNHSKKIFHRSMPLKFRFVSSCKYFWGDTGGTGSHFPFLFLSWQLAVSGNFGVGEQRVC